jgi:hypothetical protein
MCATLAPMLKDLMMKQGMKLMMNPTVMKLMADPRVGAHMMTVMTKGFQLRTQLQRTVAEQKQLLARMLDPQTHEELEALRGTVHELESTISSLRQQLGQG